MGSDRASWKINLWRVKREREGVKKIINVAILRLQPAQLSGSAGQGEVERVIIARERRMITKGYSSPLEC